MHASPLCSAQRTSRAVAASATWLARGAPRDQPEAAIRAWVGSTTWALMSRRPFLAGRPHGDSLLGCGPHLAPMGTSPRPPLHHPPVCHGRVSTVDYSRAAACLYSRGSGSGSGTPGTQLMARRHRRCGPWGGVDGQRGPRERQAEGGLDQRVTPVDRLAVSHLTQPATLGRRPIAAVAGGRTRFSGGCSVRLRSRKGSMTA